MERTNHHRDLGEPEFPGFANVFESLGEAVPLDDDPAAAALSRRSFLALSTATALAAAVGCRRPDLEILPYSAIPDDQVGHLAPGRPTFYATSIPRPGGALPVLVESHDGRPTKIEGNPKHPASLGATDTFAQASILDLYSPDRVMSDRYPGVMQNGAPRTWGDFDRFARTLAERFAKTQGEGLAILTDQTPSPSLRLIRVHVKKSLPKASWHTYEPVDSSEALKGAEIAFGQKLVPKYDFAQIDCILALDSDFLGCDPNAVEYGRAFALRRKVEKPDDKMNRLYVVESTYTVTGTMADHRLRLPASQVGGFLIAVTKELRGRFTKLPDLHDSGVLSEAAQKWVKSLAKDLAENRSAIVVGPRQPAWVHALACALNDAVGAYTAAKDKGALVALLPPPPEMTEKTIIDLTKEMRDGKVNTLLVFGGNPVFNAPADMNFREALKKVPTKIRLGVFHDQTSEACDWHLPQAHYLESWGDTETSDGTLCCVQPLIAPLNSARSPGAVDTESPPRGGRSAFEVLSLLTVFPNPADGKPVTNYLTAQKAANAAVRKVFAERTGIAADAKEFDTEFNRYKQLGFLPPQKDKVDRKPPKLETKLADVAKAIPGQTVPAPTKDALEVAFHPDYSVFDGRFAMNPWLQELPDPITKLVWDNAALVSPKTAAEFGLTTGDVVKLTANGSILEIPAYVLPGQADYSIALAFGQFGEMRIKNVPDGGGTNVFPLRKSNAMHTVAGCKLEKTGRRANLVVTQEHGVIPEGRDIVRDLPQALTRKPGVKINSFEHVVDSQKPLEGTHEHMGPKVGLPPDGHITEDDLKKGYQGGYGNKQQPPAPVTEKQKRFPLDLARPELLDSQFQWGMVIDLSACTGCSACTIACQAENNIPVVGKHEVKRNREMHWIRVDRYFSSDGHTPHENPSIVTQPLACVHCEQAPCEAVCPVNAAVHSPEGLNLQVYNRCIGTRYCSNACPYKVRRFNWFDFNKRGLNELRTATPFAKEGMSLEANLLAETLKMQKNPDVTVRMRGVMEKCTYCIQRIERGKYGAKIAAAEVAQGHRTIAIDANYKPDGPASAYRKPKEPFAAGYDLDPQGRVIVPDGIIVTACQSACPTRAITFGNVLDQHSAVYKAKMREGEYLLLGELNTKPRTSYLPRVRNPNPELT
jgi:molybdopterin-containing oxidoreductase family iron-sulfur binding subunit